MRFRVLLSCLLFCAWVGCNSSDVKDAIDAIDGIPRRPIDTSILGVNAFANDSRFGAISQQFLEIRDTLRLNSMRILMAWNDAVQPGPGASLNLSFYDELAGNIPPGMDAVIVVTGAPSWMQNPANWIDANPRTTFVNGFFRDIASRYGTNGRIVGFQLWNEPNDSARTDNFVLELVTSPENYVEMLAAARNVIDEVARGKLLIPAATTAINQNFPQTLDYNRAMRDAGAREFADKWAFHYYGKQYENLIQDGGVADFLNGLGMGLWITESGAQGTNSQLAYGEEVWPYLQDKISGIERLYQYQFTEATPADVSYGLRTLDPAFPVSDLYVWLRDR